MKNSLKKIVILDFASKNVFALDYESNLYHDVEDFFLSPGILNLDLSINNCEYMLVSAENFNVIYSID